MTENTSSKLVAALLLLLLLAQPLCAARVQMETRQLDSKLLKRTVNYDVLLPSGYADSNRRYPVLYLLQGLGGHYDSWVTATNLALYAEKHNLIIVTPEGADGWWSDSVTDVNDKYESYFIQELVPLIDKSCRTLPFRKYRGVAGLSIGGYGSLKFGAKYADKFAFAGSMSGALDAATALETGGQHPWTAAMWSFCKPSLTRVFGAANNPARAANDVFALYGGYAAEKSGELPFVYVDCGIEDPFFAANLKFAQLLREQAIAHEFRERPGAHTWYYWDEQIQDVLRLAENKLR